MRKTPLQYLHDPDAPYSNKSINQKICVVNSFCSLFVRIDFRRACALCIYIISAYIISAFIISAFIITAFIISAFIITAGFVYINAAAF